MQVDSIKMESCCVIYFAGTLSCWSAQWQESYDLRPSFESLRDRMKDMENRHEVCNICRSKIGNITVYTKDKFISQFHLFV